MAVVISRYGNISSQRIKGGQPSHTDATFKSGLKDDQRLRICGRSIQVNRHRRSDSEYSRVQRLVTDNRSEGSVFIVL